MSLEPKFLIMRKFAFKTLLALIEGAHISPFVLRKLYSTCASPCIMTSLRQDNMTEVKRSPLRDSDVEVMSIVLQT
jgi:hypothetical protein